MKCSEVRRKLSAYIDREVCDSDDSVIRDHLCGCRACAREHAEMVMVSRSLSRVEGIEVPPFFMARLRQHTQEAAFPLPFLEKIRRATFVTATAIAVFVSLFVGHRVGRTLYYSISERVAQQTSGAAEVLDIGTFVEFPDGSLSDMYDQLIAGGNNG